MDSGGLSAELCDLALAMGFDRAGVATLGPVARFDAFVSWLARGDQAEMRYLERRTQLRADPTQVLAGARSAVCVALQYAPLAGSGEAGDLWPKVARYAHGVDYHDWMTERLRLLGQEIELRYPGTVTRSYVDTGPLLERELAARAGLGVFGKNTMLLHPVAGSWFLIGEVLTTLALAPSVEIGDLCGSCTRCLDACPTGALTEPYRLDSRRCISYWTIEHRGALAEPMEGVLAGWVFGCDICQEVCPWNGGLAEVDHPELQLARQRQGLGLADLVRLTRDDYTERFRGSPLKRAKLAGLKRNALFALALHGRPGDRGTIRSVLLNDPDPAVRGHAARALRASGATEVDAWLHAARDREDDPQVVEVLEQLLVRGSTCQSPLEPGG